MNTLDALTRAICLYPREDVPRLALADWLEENDDSERATFIRDMVRHAANYHPAAGGRGSWKYKDRHGEPTLTPAMARRMRLWPWDDVSTATCRFRVRDRAFVLSQSTYATRMRLIEPIRAIVRRGFVASVHCETEGFLLRARSLFREHPIESMVLTDRQAEISAGELIWQKMRATKYVSWAANQGAIPSEIFEHLKRITGCPDQKLWDANKHIGIATYASREECNQALSDACVQYGREVAGLEVASE